MIRLCFREGISIPPRKQSRTTGISQLELYKKYRGSFFESSTFQKVQEHKNRSTDSFSNICINVIEKRVGGLSIPPIGSENPDRTSFGDSHDDFQLHYERVHVGSLGGCGGYCCEHHTILRENCQNRDLSRLQPVFREIHGWENQIMSSMIYLSRKSDRAKRKSGRLGPSRNILPIGNV